MFGANPTIEQPVDDTTHGLPTAEGVAVGTTDAVYVQAPPQPGKTVAHVTVRVDFDTTLLIDGMVGVIWN